MKIQAAVTKGPGQPFEIRDLEIDDPRADEILVRRSAVFPRSQKVPSFSAPR